MDQQYGLVDTLHTHPSRESTNRPQRYLTVRPVLTILHPDTEDGLTPTPSRMALPADHHKLPLGSLHAPAEEEVVVLTISIALVTVSSGWIH